MAPCFLSVSFFKWLVTFAPFQSVETILESIEFWRMTSTSIISVTMLFKTSKCHWFQRISDLSFASISPWLVCTKTNILCSLFIPNSCTPKNCEVKHKIFYVCVIFQHNVYYLNLKRATLNQLICLHIYLQKFLQPVFVFLLRLYTLSAFSFISTSWPSFTEIWNCSTNFFYFWSHAVNMLPLNAIIRSVWNLSL